MPFTGPFTGFGRDFFEFFEELAGNNERPWFEANKDRYREVVVAACISFIEEMAPRLAGISKHYVADPKPNGGSMFRIYRDVRFSRDKRPYKEHAAVQFRHSAGKDAHAPGFYLHLEPGKVIYGGGIWKPPAPELAKIRTAIGKDPAAWTRVINNKALNAKTGGIMGDALKRPPKGFSADEKHIEDIKRQTFFAMCYDTERAARAKSFVSDVEDGFRAVTPLMKFVCKAVGAPF